MSRLNLRGLSDRELLSNLGRMVRDERRRLVEILHHLNEVERRGLHLRRGYASLFEYCTQCLKYSESAACRRITAARCLHRFPEIGQLLETGDLSLMTVSMVSKILTGKNRGALLKSVRGKSKREVEAVVSAHAPQSPVRDRVRVVTMRVPGPASVSTPSVSPAHLEAPKQQCAANTTPPSPAATGSFLTATGGGKFATTRAEGGASSVGSATVPDAPRTQLTRRHKSNSRRPSNS